MAKFYEGLQKSLTNYQDWPKEILTKQGLNESIFLIRGKDRERPVWHYILVPANKIPELKAQRSGSSIDVTEYGRILEYRNNRGQIRPTSGWRADPPNSLQIWLGEHYSSASVHETINLVYEKDDIRLCTMQRAILKQLIGVQFCYNRQQRFHYVKLTEELQLSLARRGGIKNYDRIVTFNGSNVENYTLDQFMERFETELHLPVQMLVCDPATYEHYRSNKKLLHRDLPTVQHLKPVYATSKSDWNTDTTEIYFDSKVFCAVRWEDNNIISTVSQSAIFKSPEFTHVNDVCFVEVKGRYRKGKIMCIGLYDECEKLKTHSDSSTTSNRFHPFINQLGKKMQNILSSSSKSSLDSSNHKLESLLDPVKKFPRKQLSKIMATNSIQTENNSDGVRIDENDDGFQIIEAYTWTSFENLPNELLFYLFEYMEIQDLYKAFWGLNARLNNIIKFSRKLSLTFDEKIDPLLMKSYAPYVKQLIITTINSCSFQQFPNLHKLILCHDHSKHLTQIEPERLPNLGSLSFLLGSNFTPSSKLVHAVFSNQFPSLHHVDLGCIYESTTSSWCTSPSLRFVSIFSAKPKIVKAILVSCPNLSHLQLHISSKIDVNVTSSALSNHPLQRLTFWSDSVELTFDDIDAILTFTPNVEHLYLQTVCFMSFVNLANGIIKRLNRLTRFSCHIKEMINNDNRSNDLTTIHQMYPCFNRIQCVNEDKHFRILATK